MIMRAVIQNMVCLSSHRRQLRLLQRKQPPVKIPTDSVGSKVSIASSPFPKDSSPPKDHQNVEELQPLALQENVGFQQLDDSMEAMEVNHKE
jgi:hypothetical protein